MAEDALHTQKVLGVVFSTPHDLVPNHSPRLPRSPGLGFTCAQFSPSSSQDPVLFCLWTSPLSSETRGGEKKYVRKCLCAYNASLKGNKRDETPCRAILNKQKCLFFPSKTEDSKQVLSGGLVPVGGIYKERVQEGECSGNIVYSWMKMENWDLLKLF
jgi:hypothetical protein